VAQTIPYLRPSYRSIVRDFGNGEAEICTHLITQTPSPSQLLDRDMAAAGLPILYRRAAADDVKPSSWSGESNLERSIRRARQSIRWRVKGQGLDHMLTLTIRENFEDINELKPIWAKFVRSVKLALGVDWLYVACIEVQERGSLHVHAAVRGRQNVNLLRGLWWSALGQKVKWVRGVPQSDCQSLGNIDVKAPRNKASKWRSRSLAGYLTKYISKALGGLAAGSKRYWATKGFQAPKQVVFLAAQSLREALVETATMFEDITGVFGSPWTSPDWSCLWVST